MSIGNRTGETPAKIQRSVLVILISIALVGILLRLWLIVVIQYFEEDALITLRYGRNLINGNGWVYNLHQHILGTTSPLWTLLAAVASGLFSTGGARIALSLVDLAAYCVAAWLLVKRMYSSSEARWVAPIILVSVLAFNRLIMGTSIGGLEESLFLLTIVTAILVVERSVPAGFALAGAATLVRPEGLVLTIALLLILLAVDRRGGTILKAILSFLVVILPWVILATIYFGSPVPQSVLAKTGWNGQSLSLMSVMWRPHQLLDVFKTLTALQISSAGTVIQVALAIVGLTIFGFGAWISVRRHDRIMMTLALFFVGYIGFFYLGNGQLFNWYVLPSAAAFWSVFAIGIDSIVRDWPKLIRTGGVGAFVVLSFMQSMIVLPQLASLQGYETGVRQATGQWIARCTPANASVMMEPLGYVGYYADRQVIDLAGLVSPKFASLNRSSHVVGWPAQEILTLRPDYIVLRRYELTQNEFLSAGGQQIFADAKARQQFDQLYVPVASFSDHYSTTRPGGGPDIALVVYAKDGTSLCR